MSQILNPSGGGGGGGATQTITFVTTAQSPFTATSQSQFIAVDSTAGPVTIILPAAPAKGTVYIIKDQKGQASVNNITISPTGGKTIDLSASFVLEGNFASIQALYDDSNYEVY